jgi:hypothetical protein
MNNEQTSQEAALRTETKRKMMQAARHYEQKIFNKEQAERRLNRARRTTPARVEQAAAVLEFAKEAEDDAFNLLRAASIEAGEAGWSIDDRIFFSQEAAQEQRDLAMGGGWAQGGGRRRKTRVARKHSIRRKSATRKYKRTRRA